MFLELTKESPHGIFDSASLEGIASLVATKARKDQYIEFDAGSSVGLKHFVGQFEDRCGRFLADALFEPIGQCQRIVGGLGDQSGLLAGRSS